MHHHHLSLIIVWKLLNIEQRCTVPQRNSPAVNFINVLCALFLYECHFGSFFLRTHIHTNIEKSCRNNIRTKKACKKCWWNWHLLFEVHGVSTHAQQLQLTAYWKQERCLKIELNWKLNKEIFYHSICLSFIFNLYCEKLQTVPGSFLKKLPKLSKN